MTNSVADEIGLTARRVLRSAKMIPVKVERRQFDGIEPQARGIREKQM